MLEILGKHSLFPFFGGCAKTPNLDLFRVIAGRTKTPLSAGERLHTRWDFEQLLKLDAVSIIQPDICNCGGLSEAKKISDLAMIYDVRVQAHVAGTPIAEAAAMQLEAAIPNFFIHESYYMQPYEDNLTYCKYRYLPENGYLTVPDLPGLGQELTDEAMEQALAHLVVD
ncbi:enolase C-terminal domain-like protein [Ammoniphilus resinae]|uniref:L-alanine-DL-glutamate epimerase-like enolase superfamily enzyme n=1 Tax=Ammoniphilus resinae TaxID=861532 RepID=A0ABS4GP70_9BACL|nr:enolase C-terminal domain-like protein [Ammoniphilus resinae]MBP1931917.1 L-alanine-DL-glutamate epimerase-like enolase superfamily enzyme [Ammoniphilus resinae]